MQKHRLSEQALPSPPLPFASFSLPPSPSLFAPAMQAILSPLNLISYSLGDFHIEETGMPFGTLGVAHAFFYPKRRQFNLNTLRDTFVGKTVFFAYLYMGVPTLGSHRTVIFLP